MIVGDETVLIGLEPVAEKDRIIQFLEEGHRELVIGVERITTCLRDLSSRENFWLLEEGHPADHRLDVPEADLVRPQDPEAPLHELVVIRLVPRGDLEFVNFGAFGHLDPDLRRHNTFHIETANHASSSPKKSPQLYHTGPVPGTAPGPVLGLSPLLAFSQSTD